MENFDLNKPQYKSPPRGGLITSVPYYPIDPSTIIPESIVRYFQSLSQHERSDVTVEVSTGNIATKRNFQSFNENEGLGITFGAAPATQKKRLRQEESMMCFRQRYPLTPKMTSSARWNLRSPTHSEQDIKHIARSVSTKGKTGGRESQKQQEKRAHQTVNDPQGLVSSSADEHTSLCTSQLSRNAPPKDFSVGTSLRRRIQFEETNLAEIDKLLALAEVVSGKWQQHLFEKASRARGKIQTLQGALNTRDV